MTAQSCGLPAPRRYAAIAAVSIGSAAVSIDSSIANVALPTIARALGVGASDAVLVVAIYQLVLVMLLLPMSALGERFGLRRVYQAGQVVFACATLLCFCADSLPFLLAARAAQATGAAMVLSVATALIRSIYPARSLGQGLSINSVMVTSAAAAGPAVGGLIMGVAPWQWVFVCALPFALFSLVCGRALAYVEARDAPYDAAGAAMCAAMFGLTVGGAGSVAIGAEPQWALVSVAVGLGVGALYVRRERTRVDPVLPLDLLARPIVALSVAGGLCAFLASGTVLVSTPFRLTSAFGFSPAQIGAAIAPWPLTNILVAPLFGYLSDRISAGVLGAVGMSVTITALTLLAALPPEPSWFDIAWRIALCGAGFGIFLPPNARLIIGSAPQRRAAAASGIVGTTRLVGQTGGSILVAALLATELGYGQVPLIVATGLCLLAMLCSVARLRRTAPMPDSVDLMPTPLE